MRGSTIFLLLNTINMKQQKTNRISTKETGGDKTPMAR